MITLVLSDRQAMLVGNVVEHVRGKVAEHMLSGASFYVSELQADPQLAEGVTAALQTWLADAKAVINKIADAPVRPDPQPSAQAEPTTSDERDTDHDHN